MTKTSTRAQQVAAVADLPLAEDELTGGERARDDEPGEALSFLRAQLGEGADLLDEPAPAVLLGVLLERRLRPPVPRASSSRKLAPSRLSSCISLSAVTVAWRRPEARTSASSPK